MNPRDILGSNKIEKNITDILTRIHEYGPINEHDLEILSYCKIFHQDTFKKHEDRLLYLLGLFYKPNEHDSILGLVYQLFLDEISKEFGSIFTPVQAAIKKGISEHNIFSFSAPTSAGKSHLFRSLLDHIDGDAVIVVPSRALIAEYLTIIRDKFYNNKSILVLQSIDDINKKHTKRRIFVVTPERAIELLKSDSNHNIEFVLYDEAQISEDERRGIIFDYLVRGIHKKYPHTTKVFSHPFVKNPEAQLLKHALTENTASTAFSQQTVGKIFLEYNKDKQSFSYFSPHIEGGHLQKQKHTASNDIPLQILKSGGTILVYTSKKSLYTGKCLTAFDKYISTLEPITDQEALKIIDVIEDLIGARNRHSKLIQMMKCGVVIHHGSMPLNARYLIEKFTNMGFAKICFATSTLAQGVNLPFDLVWLDNTRFEGDEDDRHLALRNLIGRAGRTRKYSSEFDIGYVVVKNCKKFTEQLNSDIELSNISKLDTTTQNNDDNSEFVIAIKSDDIDSQYNMPNNRVDRLRSAEVNDSINTLLDLLYSGDDIMPCSTYNILPESIKDQIKEAFQNIFSWSIGRELKTGEKAVLSTAITILLWQIQGKAFKEIMALRYYYLTCQREKRLLKSNLTAGTISHQEYTNQISALMLKWSSIPSELPNSKLDHWLPPRFERVAGKTELDYDLLVYDTYDYLDKVISFSLSDSYYIAFQEHYNATSDYKAMDMANYFRYGTRDSTEILLLRYGFSFEDIELIRDYIHFIDEEQIQFTDKIEELTGTPTMDLISRYLN